MVGKKSILLVAGAILAFMLAPAREATAAPLCKLLGVSDLDSLGLVVNQVDTTVISQTSVPNRPSTSTQIRTHQKTVVSTGSDSNSSGSNHRPSQSQSQVNNGQPSQPNANQGFPWTKTDFGLKTGSLNHQQPSGNSGSSQTHTNVNVESRLISAPLFGNLAPQRCQRPVFCFGNSAGPLSVFVQHVSIQNSFNGVNINIQIFITIIVSPRVSPNAC
jgi:hypothetical protein